MKKHWWKWVCEFCYRKSNRKILPKDWDLVWQSAVCPKCQERVKKNAVGNIGTRPQNLDEEGSGRNDIPVIYFVIFMIKQFLFHRP